MFVGHPEAGQRSVVIYSVLGSCRRHGINPDEYLRDLFERLPKSKTSDLKTPTPAASAQASHATARSVADLPTFVRQPPRHSPKAVWLSNTSVRRPTASAHYTQWSKPSWFTSPASCLISFRRAEQLMQTSGSYLLSQKLYDHYHRQRSVSLPCSEWERVGPLLKGHQKSIHHLQ